MKNKTLRKINNVRNKSKRKIDTILIKVADFYEEEVDATLDSLGSIIEPIMILIMGGMVGLIAASVMGPISNLTNQIS
jgi:type IV pilus assembly protein PilC